MRYRLLYPWAAQYLFPMPNVKNNGFVGAFSSGNFQEATRAYDGRRTRLFYEAQDLIKHRFGFLNLQPVNLGNPVDWCFAPEGDRLWQDNLHYGEWAITLMQAYLISNETGFKDSLIDLFNDWIDHNPVGRGPGWEPIQFLVA